MTEALQNILSYQADNPLMFNSKLFWILFVVFLPFYGLLRLSSHRRAMLAYVIAFSLFFYYKASGWCCILLIARAVVDYYLVKMLDESPDPRFRKAMLILSLVTSVGTLAFFKYGHFALLNIETAIGNNFQPMDIVLPVGISFYTFQSVSYAVDVYKRKSARAESLLDYLFYLSFFPYIAAGPIVRAATFLPQIRQNRKITEAMVFSGLWLVITGLVKKSIIADYLAQYNDLIFSMPSGYSGFECLMGVVGYSMQIFCDFSGYSDIAIGLARIMGFDLGINFRSPYKSLNITDFWHRWHISLSSWLRDYVYIPLGGNRKGEMRRCVNLMLTMLVGGIWHGAGWNFLIWGGLHGAGLVAHKIYMREKPAKGNGVTKFLSWLLTFSFVTLLWILFRTSTLQEAMELFGSIFLSFRVDMVLPFLSERAGWSAMFALSILLVFLPVKFYKFLETRFIASRLWVKLIVFICVVQSILEFSNSDILPFIYFQF